MKHAAIKQNRTRRIASRAQRTLLPLVAVGGSLAGLPASALELGDLTVQSRLGQPLRASIAFALAPNEQLTSSCVTLGTGAQASGLPGIGRSTISIANGNIVLTGNTAMREPMVAAQVIVDCAYTANLSREYMLFIDPAGSAQDEQAAVKVAPARRSTPVATQGAAVATRRTPAARTATREPIGKSTRYRVQPGDSLSRIAERIENRPVGLWPAVTAIFDANPDAFMGNDPNRLKAGSVLTIPSFDGSEPVISVAATSSVASAASVTSTEDIASTESPAQQNVAQAVTSPETATVETAEVIPTGTTAAIIDTTSDLSPGDVVVDADNPFIDGRETANETIVIPDTELAGPTTSSTSPNVPTAVINTGRQTSTASTTSWLMWLTGGGIAIIIGLLLFGRLMRGRPGEAAIADHPARRATDVGTGSHAAIADYDLDDDSPTEENLTLDADLEMGTGLGASGDMEVASDFGFASPTEVDIELPFEPEPSIPASGNTDMLSPLHTDEQTILDSEILPDDDNYDLSVILDATKMPKPEDITALDLQAVDVTPEDDTSETDAYTINDEVELNILEQDYEDELTATQALNAEIKHAVAELAKDLDEGESDDETATGPTAEMPPLASVTELDITAQMTARDENADDADETGTHEAATIEMPAAENDDETTEMEVDGGKAGTKGV
ncbi:MAG: LysM peptidoglycan-binding domain-containing protein [Gammaproteobacteria bacterium]|nr:LysM peptidoglycan-binding domain-containing protein [Gammaproteobacteria bacterium]